MTTPIPSARLGVVLSSSNRWVEPYFRAHGPETLAIHLTRMRMASQARAALDVAAAAAVEAARLVADARVDVIDLQMTGLVMAMGAEAEAKVVKAIEDATGIPAYTATQALVEALRALSLKHVLSITPFDAAANGREKAYLEAAGVTFAGEVGLNLIGGTATAEVPPETWVEAACANDSADAQGILLSGSNTTMVDAIQPIEDALGKPVVTSVQAALWGGICRVKDKLGAFSPSPALGRLMEVG
jgi:maleate cis-trans isomerase